MAVYLDHNATSSLRASARAALNAALAEAGNASSVHGAGRRARARVEAARAEVAALADAPAASVVFTSGGSEANALALRGAVAGALAAEDRITRIFFSTVEHDSVRANALALAESIPGVKASEIPVTPEGVIDPAAFRLQFMQGKGRALVSVMAANNETGALQPLAEIVKIVRAEDPDTLVHVDAVQAAGRVAVSFAALGADFLTLSAHKLGGPQGAGALIVRDGAPFAAVFAGAQELGRRGGTENVAAIAGFGAAAAESCSDAAESDRLRRLRDGFEAGLRALAPDAVIFSAATERLPNTSNFAIPGLTAEAALIALDLDGVAVSSGAACASGKVKPSHVLGAMGVPEDLARCGLRVSFGWSSTDEDSKAALAALARVVDRTTRKAAAA
jgi:cysteine desulfurase